MWPAEGNKKKKRGCVCEMRCTTSGKGRMGTVTYLVSAIPAKALYQARNAASIPKPPPALVSVVAEWAAPLLAAYSPQANMRKAKSRVKNSMKNMMVDRRVQSRRMVVKMNQPVRKKPTALLAM